MQSAENGENAENEENTENREYIQKSKEEHVLWCRQQKLSVTNAPPPQSAHQRRRVDMPSVLHIPSAQLSRSSINLVTESTPGA